MVAARRDVTACEVDGAWVLRRLKFFFDWRERERGL